MAKLSIIIPVYNRQEYLKECLNSIINQSFKDIEIICINDGSTDNSGNILEEYSKKDPRIKVFHNKKNKGQSIARNIGLQIAQGEWIAFVDSDDIVDKNLYFKALEKTNEVEIVIFGISIFGECFLDKRQQDENYYKIKYSGLKSLNNSMRLDIDCSPCNKLFKKNIIKQYNITFPEHLHYEDAAFYWKYILHTQKAYFLREKLYFYRRHNNSIMASTFKKVNYATDHLRVIEDIIIYCKKYKLMSFENYTTLERLLIDYFWFSFNHSPNIVQKTYSLKLAKKLSKKYFRNSNNEIIKNFIQGNYSAVVSCEEYLKPKPNLIQRIFSITNIESKNNKYYKVIYLIGFKISFRNKKKEQQVSELMFRNNLINEIKLIKKNNCENFEDINNKFQDINNNFEDINNKFEDINNKLEEQNYTIKKLLHELDNINILICELYISNQISEIKNNLFELYKYISEITRVPEYLSVDSNHNYLNVLINQDEFYYKANKFNQDKFLISWELARWPENIATILYAIKQNKKLIFIGDSFLRSICTMADKNAQDKYRKGISFGFDDLGYYYDATRTNRMEQMLNDKNLIIDEEELRRARQCIDKIIKTHLTKYNHQPIYEPKIGRNGVKKVLVVDQTYGDMSILKGLADENTFKNMLESAINENPDADIIIKTHPDTIAGAGGYYKGLKAHDNIYTLTEPINPISLIKYVDKVYVCTTQFGFEALMCGKEVHVFGMPFYAGWGLTHDRQKCERRTNKRSLEEIFYIAYIMYSHYVNPDTKCRCEIEEAMDYLLKLRDEYFEENRKD